MLDPVFIQEFIKALESLPSTEQYATRSNLLSGIPGTGVLERNANNRYEDFVAIITALDKLGRLEAGQQPLIMLATNALARVQDYPEVAGPLRGIIQYLEEHYNHRPPFRQVVITSLTGAAITITPNRNTPAAPIPSPNYEHQTQANQTPSPEASNPPPRVSLEAILRQITEQFIQLLEKELRMEHNNPYWPDGRPQWDESYAVVYFSRQAQTLLTLRVDIDDLYHTLAAQSDSRRAFVDRTRAILSRVDACTRPINQLMDQVDKLTAATYSPTGDGTAMLIAPRHPYSTNVRLVADSVVAQVTTIRDTLHAIRWATAGRGSGSALGADLTTQVYQLSNDLLQFSRELDRISGAARSASPYLN